MSDTYTKNPCERPGCGHSPDWHRLDDALNLSPTDPAAPFRCLGPNFDGCAGSCPDFVGEAVTLHEASS